MVRLSVGVGSVVGSTLGHDSLESTALRQWGCPVSQNSRNHPGSETAEMLLGREGFIFTLHHTHARTATLTQPKDTRQTATARNESAVVKF